MESIAAKPTNAAARPAVADRNGGLRVLFVAPAYAPAEAFGGPIPVMRSLAAGLAERGHCVDVLTTSLTAVDRPPRRHTRALTLDATRVVYLGTPLRYRWMGVTPTLPAWLGRLPRPDVVHIFGFRDPLGTATAAWCRANGIAYVFEALGMYRPKLRKVKLKQLLDSTVFRHVPANASLLIAVSQRERDEYIDGGIQPNKIVIRPNGFPTPATPQPTDVRRRLRLPEDAPLVLSVGRVAAGKGLQFLVEAMPQLGPAHLVIVGPDDGHGVPSLLSARADALGIRDRVHIVGQLPRPDVEALYDEAFALALVSQADTFGMAASEAASAGLALVVSDRCGIAELLADGALIVPYDRAQIAHALRRLLESPDLRDHLGTTAREIARRHAWPRIAQHQERIYHLALSRAGAPLT